MMDTSRTTSVSPPSGQSQCTNLTAVYDGQHRIGAVGEYAGQFVAFTNRGTVIGVFAS